MKPDDYRQYFSMSYDEFIAKNNVEHSQVHGNVGYEKLANVTRVDLRDGEYFFFKEKTLQIVYVSDETLVSNIWNEFKSTVDSTRPEKMVRSRAGKTSNQLIFAAKGFTVSLTKDEVHFIEIYPPCSLDHYLEHIYQEVAPFIR